MADLDELFATLRGPSTPGDARAARVRGDRLRRRRSAAVLGAGAVAVALTVGAVTWSGVGTPDSARDPASPGPAVTEPRPSPTSAPTPEGTAPTGTTWVTTIPADLPLADGWPEPDGVELALAGPSADQAAFDRTVVCGRTEDLRPAGAVERRAARLSGIAFGGDRLLLTYRDAAAAEAALRDTVEALDGCPRGPSAPPDQEVLLSLVEPVDLGDEARQVTMYSEIDGAPALYATVYHVVRTGNALLLAFESSEGGGSAEALAREQRSAVRSLTGVVDELCRYRQSGC